MTQLTPTDTDAPATDQAGLNAIIDAELGLPPQEAPKTEEPSETPETPTEEPAEPDESEPASEENPEEVEPPTEAEPEETEPAEPATPSNEDLFIEVEDAEGVTHKISTWDDLPDDFEAKNNKEAMRIVAEMNKLDAKREQREADAAVAEAQAAESATQAQQFQSWDAEVEGLAKTGRIDIKDTDRIDAVFGYMNDVNIARMAAKNPNLITSFEDALDKYEFKESKDEVVTKAKQEADTAKKKAALIGRSSAASGDTYVYRAGSAKSIDDIPV